MALSSLLLLLWVSSVYISNAQSNFTSTSPDQSRENEARNYKLTFQQVAVIVNSILIVLLLITICLCCKLIYVIKEQRLEALKYLVDSNANELRQEKYPEANTPVILEVAEASVTPNTEQEAERSIKEQNDAPKRPPAILIKQPSIESAKIIASPIQVDGTNHFLIDASVLEKSNILVIQNRDRAQTLSFEQIEHPIEHNDFPMAHPVPYDYKMEGKSLCNSNNVHVGHNESDELMYSNPHTLLQLNSYDGPKDTTIMNGDDQSEVSHEDDEKFDELETDQMPDLPSETVTSKISDFNHRSLDEQIVKRMSTVKLCNGFDKFI